MNDVHHAANPSELPHEYTGLVFGKVDQLSLRVKCPRSQRPPARGGHLSAPEAVVGPRQLTDRRTVVDKNRPAAPERRFGISLALFSASSVQQLSVSHAIRNKPSSKCVPAPSTLSQPGNKSNSANDRPHYVMMTAEDGVAENSRDRLRRSPPLPLPRRFILIWANQAALRLTDQTSPGRMDIASTGRRASEPIT